ncbi:MAG: MarR family transcriptional regulator [Steroidobacteraceae bacterium]
MADARTRGDPKFTRFRIADSPFYRLARCNGRYVQAMERELKRIDMDIPRWRTLMIVHEHEPSSVSEIAELAAMRLSTMTRVVQRLARDRLVRVAPRESDGRKTDVYLTANGQRAVDGVRHVASDVYRKAVASLTAAEVSELVTLLGKLFDGLASVNPVAMTDYAKETRHK